MEKFHHFLYARHFILETDQKPLEAILSQCLYEATPRLQRILIRSFSYHFTVCYIPGLTNQLADCLSQLGGQKDTVKLPKIHLYQITKQLSARSNSLNQLRLATQEDDELALLKYTITQGWPSTIKEIWSVIQPYWTFHEELTIEDGLALKRTRIVIPNKKHEVVLKLIHKGHLGLNNCKLHTKDAAYWSILNDQLEKNVIELWNLSKIFSIYVQATTYLISGLRNTPTCMDKACKRHFFHFEGVVYLLIVDYTSRFPVVHKLSSMTAQHVTTHCNQVFLEYGWPETPMSDNGLCYSVEVFTNLMQGYGVNHFTSSSHYSQSNGLAVKYVQIVKNLFHKAKEEEKDMFKCLMIYCNTPLSSNSQSPMQNIAK